MSNLVLKTKQKGFTLIELLVVIGILAVLLSIVLIAINPAKQFGQANNTKRRSDVNAVLNAVGSYAADNKGQLPGGVPGFPPAVDAKTICASLVTKYISALPVDPTINNGNAITDCTAPGSTGYTLIKDSDSRVTVAAQTTDNGETISVTR